MNSMFLILYTAGAHNVEKGYLSIQCICFCHDNFPALDNTLSDISPAYSAHTALTIQLTYQPFFSTDI